MKYDDLLNIPYKTHGRTLDGLDCYGVVVECCRRAGTPLHDPYYESDTVPINEAAEYVAAGLNVEPIEWPEVGAIALMEYGGKIHTGYMVARDLILHATYNKGVIISHVGLVNVVQYYRVKGGKNESEYI